MAQCKLSAPEFIKNTFTPQIAIICSPGADEICRKNNLSFVELVQPFSKLNTDISKLNTDISLHDPSGGTTTIHDLKLSFLDVNFRPPQPTLARKFLNASVSQAVETRTQNVEVDECSLTIPASTPWFEAWREMFLQVQFPSDHEYTKHFLACVLVVSASEADPIGALNHLSQALNQMQNIVPNKLPKWFTPTVARYYVLLEDTIDAEDTKTHQTLDSMNISFGSTNCFLLKINSRLPRVDDEALPDPWSQFLNIEREERGHSSPNSSPPASRLFYRIVEKQQQQQQQTGADGTLSYHPLSPDTENQKLNETLEKEIQLESSNILHGQYLTIGDIDQIKLFVHEFCTWCLIPYVAKQINILTESVSNRKGVSKSLFSATKRWFNPPNKGSLTNGSINMLFYSYDAPELQLRKLGDLYFMFGHYSMAFQAYHAAKRDFNGDQAWLYYAGALEMAALAAFMANETTRKTTDYIEEGIVTYLNTCKMAQFATRATLLSSECLKSRGLHGEAAHQLIRMTSEESDLRSALLLEQASFCFLNCTRSPMLRKYAFHMVLSGHRFSKAAQRKHALRCYRHALEIYQDKGWAFAQDHVHYTIGKLSAGLDQLEEAASSFSKLLTIQSKQTVEQQTLFLKEYLTIHRLLVEKGRRKETPILILPELKMEHLKVLVGPTTPLSVPGKVRATGVSFYTKDDAETKQKWLKLEEMLVQEAQGQLPLLFKPLITLYTRDNVNVNLIAIINEPIQVSVTFHNPLSVTVTLKDLYLLWTFRTKTGAVISNEKVLSKTDQFLKTNVIKNVVVQNNNMQDVVLVVTPLVIGELTLEGVYYNIANLENSEEISNVAGKQIFDMRKLAISRKGGQDKESEQMVGFTIPIVPPAPCLQVYFADVSVDMLCDEIQPVLIEMRNVGRVPLHNISLATSTPQLLSSCEFRDKSHKFKEVIESDAPAIRERLARKNHITQVVLPNDRLQPGHTHTVNIWLRAPSTKGPVMVDLLIYYESCNSTSVPRYRLIRHIWILKIFESLSVDLTVTESSISEGIKELLFGIKATNTNKAYLTTLTQITLYKACLLSSWWKFQPMKYVNVNNALTIGSEQSAYILLKGQRQINKYNKYFELPLSPEQPSAKHLAFLDFAKSTEQNRINIFEDAVLAKPPPLKDGLLFFQWRARIFDNSKKEKTAIGQTYVVIDKVVSKDEPVHSNGWVAPLEPLSLETSVCLNDASEVDDLKSQISITIAHNSTVYHNFNLRKICVTPVKITVHNDSLVDSTVTVNTASRQSISSVPTNLFYSNPSKDYRWVGFSGTVTNLSSLSSDVIALNVAVTSPGVYDLGGRLEVWCQNKLNEKPVLQDINGLGFLTVRSIN